MTSVSELVARMRATQQLWEEQEPRSDWWHEQRDHAEAADLIEAQAAEINALRIVATNARLSMPVLFNILKTVGLKQGAETARQMMETIEHLDQIYAPRAALANTPAQQEGGQ